MKPRTKTIFGWCIVIVVFILFLGLLFPTTHGRGPMRGIVHARILIQNFDIACREYKAEYGHYPSGRPSEIMAALAGKNPRGINFMHLPAARLNPSGELTDLWSTPFRFTRVSDYEPPQLTSAGPDKKFGTEDDVTINNR